MSWGSSPHVRGAPSHGRRPIVRNGIIPACAGSTNSNGRTGCSPRDHPRMCGEHAMKTQSGTWKPGSSPHVRGAPQGQAYRRTGFGIIPACAGSTICKETVRIWRRDHPRMCGEHAGVFGHLFAFPGSSPHVRGAPRGIRRQPRAVGIIPACAGSTSPLALKSGRARDHPRMCGEHCRGVVHGRPSKGSSPHVRGALG